MVKTDLLMLLKKTDEPISVPQILEKIDANKTTIYRELEGFIKEGLVCEVELGDGKKRYEMTNKGHHHHLICTNCKRIEEIKIGDDFENEEKKLERKTGFILVRHNLEFLGLCSNCK